MSHFAVFVLCNNEDEVNSLLAPYNEQDEAYYKFCPVFNSEKEARKAYSEWRKDPDNKEDLSNYNFKTWIDKWHGYHEVNGRYGYNCNPNAKWDCWMFGGRYYEHLTGKIKRNAKPDEDGVFCLRNIVTEPSITAKKDAEEFWHKYVLNEDPEYDPGFVYKREYYKEIYGDCEFFCKCRSFDTMPFAFVTPDGVWHERGSMGWWACVTETKESIVSYINEWLEAVKKYGDKKVYVVDCHI